MPESDTGKYTPGVQSGAVPACEPSPETRNGVCSPQERRPGGSATLSQGRIRSRGALVVALACSTAPAGALGETGYRIGPGDVLTVEVVGHPELSTAPAVRPDGRIRLPDGQSLAVVELTPEEVARAAAAALRRSLPSPVEVRVAVSVYRSRFVSVEGAVQRPGRLPLRGSTRLVDVLVEAGGFAPGASGEVVILRLSDDAAPLHRLSVEVDAGLDAVARVNLSQPLRHGDRVAVLQTTQVVVGGAVRRPGIFRLRDAPTLLSALASAGGTTARASRAVLRRRQGQDLEVALEAARRGEATDPALAPGDVITVR